MEYQLHVDGREMGNPFEAPNLDKASACGLILLSNRLPPKRGLVEVKLIPMIRDDDKPGFFCGGTPLCFQVEVEENGLKRVKGSTPKTAWKLFREHRRKKVGDV